MNKTDLKLYAITDRQWLHGARLSEHVKLAIEGGATMIQIRDKTEDFGRLASLSQPQTAWWRTPTS